MITRIELTNFMSHEHTVLEPAAGLTVLVGPNNCGKSAVVGALQILAHNENSKYVVRHGEKECTVRVETDDGHVIEWRRKNNSPRYTIDGEQFDRLGRGGTPEQLQNSLRLGKVGTGERDTDVHFGDQKRPIFLLDSSELHAAQFFASSSDASHFVEMQTLHKQKTAAAQKEKVRLEAESARLNRELATLEPVADLDEQLRTLEQVHVELCDLARCITQHAAELSKLQTQERSRSRYEAESQVLSRLPTPPELAPEQPLALLIQRLRQFERIQRQSQARAVALTPLTNPPVIAATAPLEKLSQAISRSAKNLGRAQGTLQSLRTLSEPPDMHNLAELQRARKQLGQCQQELRRRNRQFATLADLVPPQLTEPAAAMRTLEACLTQLRAAAAREASCEADIQSRLQELENAAQRIKEWASLEQVCPACGSTLDPQRLVELVASKGAGK